MCCGCPITYQSAAGKAGRKFGQHSRLRGHTYCRWNRQEGPPAAAGAHFVLALGVMSCVERSDWLRHDRRQQDQLTQGPAVEQAGFAHVGRACAGPMLAGL